MANDRDRERRRNGENCPPEEWTGPFDRPAPSRPLPPCDPPPVPPEPDFLIPDALPGIPDALVTPGGLVYRSPETTVTCADNWPANTEPPHASGPDVTVPEGQFTATYHFQNLGLDSPALDYIARVLETSEEAVRDLVEQEDVQGLASLLNISTAEAQEVIDDINEIEAGLEEQALSLGISLLDCAWANTEVTLSCADEYPEGEFGSANPGPGNPVTVAAGTFFSGQSQAEADELALAHARSLLSCGWGNAELTVHCSDLGMADLDPGDEDPTEGGSGFSGDGFLPVETADDPGPAYPGNPGRRRINTVTVPANTFTSAESQGEADEAALSAALAALDCFYLNPPVTARCDSLEGSGQAEVPVDYDGVTTGNPVSVPARAVASEISWDDAEAQALLLGQAFLDCFWGNREVTYACDDKDFSATDPAQVANHFPENYPGYDEMSNKQGQVSYFTSLNTLVELMASPVRSAPYHVTVTANSVRSQESQDDADEQAAMLAQSQLGCIYCNPRVNPVCVPDEIDPETADLPIPYESVQEDWSMDVTLGVPGVRYEPAGSGDPWRPVDLFGESDAGAFMCSSDPGELAGVTDSVALIPYRQLTPASRNENCRYGNAPVYGACRPQALPGGGSGDSTYVLPEGGIPAIPVSAYADYFSPRSTEGYILVSPDTIQAGSKDEANAIATSIALGQLNCFFESPNLTVLCGATTAGIALGPPGPFQNPEGDPGDVVFGDGKVGGDLVFAGGEVVEGGGALAGSTGHPATPVIVLYGTGISFASPLDALTQAVLVGMGQLDCFFYEADTATCVSRPDTRLRFYDGRINGLPWIPVDGTALGTGRHRTNPEDPIQSSVRYNMNKDGSGDHVFGGYYNEISSTEKTGQVARFRYSGVQTVAGMAAGTNVPGTTPPSATETAKSYTSKADAKQQAKALALARLDCTHTNWGRSYDFCGKGDRLALAGVVWNDTFTAESTESANLMAEVATVALVVCVPARPFSIGVQPQADGSSKWRVTPGGAVYYGSTLECMEDLEPGAVITKMRLENCSGDLIYTGDAEDPSSWRSFPGSGSEHLFWVTPACCSGEPVLLLKITPNNED